MELADSRSRSSDGDRRLSPSETPPFQTLREAVWSKVAGTLLKQEEDRLAEPAPDSPMNLTNQCTIRGQQIIEHIIENILDKPMDGADLSDQHLTFSLNNNQGAAVSAAAEVTTTAGEMEIANTIKASIYESLKNDLLKKGSPGINSTASSAAPAVQPNKQPNCAGRPKPNAASKAADASRQEANSGAKLLPVNTATAAAAANSGHAEVKPTGGGSNGGHSASTTAAAVGGSGQPKVVIAAGQPGLAPPSTQPGLVNNGVITSPRSPAEVMRMLSSQPLLTPVNVGASSVTITRTGRGPPPPVTFQPSEPRPAKLSVAQPGQVPSLVMTAGRPTGQVVLTPAAPGQVVIAGKLLIAAPADQQAAAAAGNPVNLSVAKPEPAGSVTIQEITTGNKRPHAEDDEDKRRSTRTCKGRRYQEFIEDGRISVGGRKGRRSHRSGEEGSEPDSDPSVDPLPQEESLDHWKKKLRTASLGDNTQSPELQQSSSVPGGPVTASHPPDFDLDAKIEALRPLSLDDFQKC